MSELIAFLTMLGLLCFGHALADYPLQGDFLARAKNRFAPIQGVPWRQAMMWHAVIHGGFVGVITGSIWLGLFEAIIHAMIDDAKCAGTIGFNTDQALHVLAKVGWAALAIWYLNG